MIRRETEGNPFFVEEVYLALVESGVLLDEHGRLRSDLRLDEVSVPESIRLVVGQRLTAWPRPPVGAGSRRCVGQDVHLRDRRRGGGMSEDALVEAFDEAERAGSSRLARFPASSCSATS